MRAPARVGTLGQVDEEQGIYRGEVEEIMFALADIKTDLSLVLQYLLEDDNGEEEEEEDL